ncbi:uncharacterized protein [Lepisosteus oculatus]|uniref:uncharacterized protein n=1 Tax=Lepisosteus oculatus TaxID=7918 RepID=UPI00371A2A98
MGFWTTALVLTITGVGVEVALFPQEMECRFGEADREKPKVWCKQNTTQCCSGFAVSSAEESLYGGQVTIRVLRDQNKFTVSIAQLPEGEGRYWCGVLNPDNTMVKLGEADFSDGEVPVWDILRWALLAALLLSSLSSSLYAKRRTGKEKRDEAPYEDVQMINLSAKHD